MVSLMGTPRMALVIMARLQVEARWLLLQLEDIPWSWLYAWDCFGGLWSKAVEHTSCRLLWSSLYIRNLAIVDRPLIFVTHPFQLLVRASIFLLIFAILFNFQFHNMYSILSLHLHCGVISFIPIVLLSYASTVDWLDYSLFIFVFI